MPKVHISAFCGLSRCHYSNSPRSRTQYTEAFASKSWTRSSVSEKCFFQSMESQRVKSWKHAAGKVIRDIRDIPYLLRRHSIWLWIINIWCIMIMVYSGYIYIPNDILCHLHICTPWTQSASTAGPQTEVMSFGWGIPEIQRCRCLSMSQEFEVQGTKTYNTYINI